MQRRSQPDGQPRFWRSEPRRPDGTPHPRASRESCPPPRAAMDQRGAGAGTAARAPAASPGGSPDAGGGGGGAGGSGRTAAGRTGGAARVCGGRRGGTGVIACALASGGTAGWDRDAADSGAMMLTGGIDCDDGKS